MFKPVSPRIDFSKMERELLDWWHKSGIIAKYLHRNDKSPRRFSFLDGPITANNPMGVHHAWGRTYKDLFQRHKNMQGFRQRFQNGFDNQGLWVEVEVEKELGFKSKRDIEKYGIEKFVNKCKERTLKFAKIQTEQSKRLAYFMDWDNSYYTMSDENNYMIWYFLKKCHEKGLIYKGLDSVPWCPRCGTAISQHEILTEEYQEITHKAVYVKYPILNRENEYFLVWTTTPWTLPANVAIAANPKLSYVKVKQDGEVYCLAKAMVASTLVKYEILEEFPGKKLVGLAYQSPYDHLLAWKNLKTVHKVIPWEEAGEEEGTGLVHIAPGAGHEDFVLAKKENLPVILAIDEEANYFKGFGEFSGKNAARNPELILEDLQKRGFIYRIQNFPHRYPVCWRCKTELVFRAVPEWYIAMDNLRKSMMEIAKKIHWIPSFGLERELDWLANMQDWLISKKRYWGLALPIWECQKCGGFEIIGGKDELKEKAVSGWENFVGHSPHRPWIDEVKIKCKCGEIVSRIPDVGNPWLDAGIVPFSTMTPDWFPADFITESFPGQFKNWFYSLLAMSTVLKNGAPFKTVLGFATLLAEDGRPMHKSLGNAIEFNEGADKIGVDVMRWMYVTQDPASNLLFGFNKADEVRRRFHLMLWNIYNFFITYANADKVKSQKSIHSTSSGLILSRVEVSKVKSQNVFDRWIISRLHQLIETVTDSLDNYDAQTASLTIEKFVEDLSLWYVRRSRNRVGPTAPDDKDKNACYQTLYEVLVTLSKLLAPFTPFLAEEIYKNLTAKESVHLSDWPKINEKLVDKSLDIQMVLGRKLVEVGHSLRKEHKLKTRQPLSLAWHDEPREKLTNIDVLHQVLEELNIKGWIHEDNFDKFVKKKGVVVKEIDGFIMYLDTTLTDELKAEGEVRELVRQIQELRKEKGCRLDEKIVVYAPSYPAEFEEYIKQQTMAKKIICSKSLKISTG
ncbi:MAG: isoleucyl-tRNA synthetase [Microgenomates group bacterium LiPW_16]|nr:MAG: isoleucyl-tRNA synthetase [Microgenomates group bacterium LiPW_16]